MTLINVKLGEFAAHSSPCRSAAAAATGPRTRLARDNAQRIVKGGPNGMGPTIAADARGKILTLEGIDEAEVELVWDPAWNQSMISEAGRMKLGLV